MFLDTKSLDQPHDIRLIGAPFDGTVSFRPGARFGPAAIRTASYGLETYSAYLDGDLESVRYADSGDLKTAAAHLEKILEIDPDHEIARQYLENIRKE